MKKVLLAFDAADFSQGAFEFVQRLNELQPILLTGVFLPAYNYAPIVGPDGMVGYTMLAPEEPDREIMQQSIKQFEALCQKNGIAYRVHKDFYLFALPELKKEARFADLLIVGSETFYSNLTGSGANANLREVVHTAECPVVVVPETFTFPERNVLAYDGSESSVYAIKQFAYLFPELCINETLLVYANPHNEAPIPEEHYVEELATQHFKNLTLFKLAANPKKYFATLATEEKGAIVVCGAYGRSAVSQFFKRSFVSDVIASHKLPVFIAHP